MTSNEDDYDDVSLDEGRGHWGSKKMSSTIFVSTYRPVWTCEGLLLVASVKLASARPSQSHDGNAFNAYLDRYPGEAAQRGRSTVSPPTLIR